MSETTRERLRAFIDRNERRATTFGEWNRDSYVTEDGMKDADARALDALVAACERFKQTREDGFVELGNNGDETERYAELYEENRRATVDMLTALRAITQPDGGRG